MNSDRLKIYNYDQNFVLRDTEQAYADWSPLEERVALIPFRATSTTPAVEAGPGEVLVYDLVGDVWNVRPATDFAPAEAAPAGPTLPAPAEPEAVLPMLPVEVPTTLEQRVQMLLARAQLALESIAQFLGYRSMDVAVSYVGDENPKFDLEARSLKVWRSRLETAAYAITAEILKGDREEPVSPEAFEALLPSYADVAAEVAGA